ncbi:hypothetical protein EHI45_00745 [Rhizobium leguminosarum]|uniref:hypothetical protein n=1 Tax=Rhizobium leguminosarum TaxID=384 RepID=UPI000FEC7F28|nr:hypothetical protein [Rhizobium leguminosarum]RWX19203.1 hypothetical protein EHI45_00745 [Rhizobium leguminosarum]
MQRVPKVVGAHASFHGEGQGELTIVAVAEVPTTGWSNGILAARRYIATPADGIQDFGFYATPPAGRVIKLEMQLFAELTVSLDIANYWRRGEALKGIRIHSESNDVEADIEEARSANMMAEGMPLPGPFPWARGHSSSIHGGDIPFSLSYGGDVASQFACLSRVGKTLRVYHTGDLLTDDYKPSRVSIELNPTT